jgi:hypothetical protein
MLKCELEIYSIMETLCYSIPSSANKMSKVRKEDQEGKLSYFYHFRFILSYELSHLLIYKKGINVKNSIIFIID